MKISEIPNEALFAPATPIPTQIRYDWDALFQVLLQQGFVIIESDNIRTLPTGAEECILVKAFNSHCVLVKKQNLRTKRISATRWFCTL